MDLVAGPQGSGKSTFFPVAGRGFDSFNIDDRRRDLNGGDSQRISAEIRRQSIDEYQRFIETHIGSDKSFSIEVTLANPITFDQAERGRKQGFRVYLTFVAAEREVCQERVRRRLLSGGHGVSRKVLDQTYDASMENLRRALREFDYVEVFDSSFQAGSDESLEQAEPRLLLVASEGVVARVTTGAPSWLETAMANSDLGPP